MLVLTACRFGFEGRPGPFDAPSFAGDSTDSVRDSVVDSVGDGAIDGLPALCPVTYTNYSGHKYRYDTMSTIWTTAQTNCLSDQVMGSSLYTHLAVVGDMAEVGVIQSNFTGNGNVWIGLSDRSVDGTFVWVTTEATAGFPPATGGPWTTNEPSGNTGENCGYEGAFGFNDGLCTPNFHYVCECDTSPDAPANY